MLGFLRARTRVERDGRDGGGEGGGGDRDTHRQTAGSEARSRVILMGLRYATTGRRRAKLLPAPRRRIDRVTAAPRPSPVPARLSVTTLCLSLADDNLTKCCRCATPVVLVGAAEKHTRRSVS